MFPPENISGGGTSPTTEVMTEVQYNANLQDFIATGRTGRRNAVPDILGPNATVSTGSLPFEMEKLNCSDDGEAEKSSTACANAQSTNNAKPPGS